GGPLLWRAPCRRTPPPPPRPPSAPASPFLNTGPDARYVGSEACYKCHEDRRDSFRETGMGRSMAAADPDHEPPDAAFDHPASKRRYQGYRKDGRLRHRES